MTMSSKEWHMFQNQLKVDKYIEANRYYCKCGHSLVIKPTQTRKMCTWCGNWVFRTKLDEFKYRTKEQMNKC